MRKITREASEAFANWVNYKNNNTLVKSENDYIYMFLHGNEIAKMCKKTEKLYISNCGWHTNTTKERLNGVLEVLGIGKIQQIKGKWFFIDDVIKLDFDKVNYMALGLEY